MFGNKMLYIFFNIFLLVTLTKMEAIIENASKRSLKWFPPHMRMGLNKVNSILPNVSLVLEVRDARAPFGSKNGADLEGTLKSMKNKMGETIRRCIIFNKTDLACPEYLKRVQKMFSDPYNKKELGIESVFFISANRQEQVKPIVRFIKSEIYDMY